MVDLASNRVKPGAVAVSTKEQVKNLSLSTQEKACRDHCARRSRRCSSTGAN